MSTTEHVPKISDLTSATGDVSERKMHKTSSIAVDNSHIRTETNPLIIEEKDTKIRRDLYGNEIKKVENIK